MIAVDSMIPALPQIAAGLGVSQGDAPLLITTYLLGYASAQIPVGLLSDRYGRRHVLLIGLLVFEATAFAVVWAPTLEFFLVARFLMGVAGATGPVVGRAVLRDTHEGIELGRVMALLVAVLAAGTMLAPLSGTLLVMFIGWHAPLWVPIVVTAAALLLVFFSVPESHTPDRDLGLIRQITSSARMFLSSRQACWGTMMLGAAFFGFFGITGLMGSVFVEYFALDPDLVGWFFTGAAAFYMCGGILCRRLLSSLDPVVVAGYSVGAFALALCLSLLSLLQYRLQGDFSLALFATCIALYFVALGLVFAPSTTIALQPVPSIAGFGASVLGSFQMGMGTMGTWIGSVVYDGTPAPILYLMLAAVLTISCLWFARFKLLA